MGKGSGCGNSKNVQDEPNQKGIKSTGVQQPPVAQPTSTPIPASNTATPVTMSSSGTRKIYVIFYTTYGHIYKMVEQVAKGINSVPGTEAVVLQVLCHVPLSIFTQFFWRFCCYDVVMMDSKGARERCACADDCLNGL